MKNTSQINKISSVKLLISRVLFAFIICLSLGALSIAPLLADREMRVPQIAKADSDIDWQFSVSADSATVANLDSLAGKAAYLMDVATGSVIYARSENERLPIASMTKIMTALLTMEAADRGDISWEEQIPVSEEAAGMGGSQVFLDAGSTHRADELMKSVIVASANDSCVALAERISGSVSGFVSTMNTRAKELGMTDTNFKNCTGLPAAESFSSAKDVAIMFNELIKHPKFFEYSTIWLEDYQHPSGRATTMTNTNKLVRFYNGCDGGKTGFTSESKFCLAATAKRDGMRLISVVIGADSSKSRFAAISEMFNHGFANYENKVMLAKGNIVDNTVEVLGGKKGRIALTVRDDVAQFIKRGETAEYEIRLDLPEKIKAPVRNGDVVGSAILTKDGVVVSTTDIIAAEDIERMSLFDAISHIGKLWTKGF